MSNQAQIDAIECLLMGILKSSGSSIPASAVFEKANELLLGSNGPGGKEEQAAAKNYLDHLKLQLKS